MTTSYTRRVTFLAVCIAVVMALVLPHVSFAQTTTPTSANTVTFTPLTQLPGIQDAANSTTLPSFLNTLYKICIGAGAVLAVIMIMIAGFEFMTSRGSVASNEKAKTRLRNALIGLLLVLSPTIVFGIINPKILDLDFTADLQKLQLDPLDHVDGTLLTPAQQQQCSSITKKKSVEVKQGEDAATKCSAVGKGWARYDDQCCSITDNSHACCGYDAKNDQGTPAPPTPESQKGNFSFDFAAREYDGSDQDGGYCIMEHTYRFTTSQACSAALANARNSKSTYAYSDNCSGKLGQMTPKSTYDQISRLHSCQE